MDYINYIVIGIGINVQNEAFPEEIGEVATSLRIESGKKQNRAAIIEAVWEEFEKYYDIYLKTEDMQGLVGEYNRKLANMNQQVRVLDPKDPYEGTARGITPKGELIVDTWEARKLVSSGEYLCVDSMDMCKESLLCIRKKSCSVVRVRIIKNFI